MLVVLNASNDLKIRKKNKTHKCASHTKSLVNVKSTPKKKSSLKMANMRAQDDDNQESGCLSASCPPSSSHRFSSEIESSENQISFSGAQGPPRRRLSPSLSRSDPQWLTSQFLAGGSGAGRAPVTWRGRFAGDDRRSSKRYAVLSLAFLLGGSEHPPSYYAFGSDPITVYTLSYPLTSMLIIGCTCLLPGPPLIPFSFSISCNLDVLKTLFTVILCC